MSLSILIPARNEMFLKKTIEDILSNIQGDTEVIAVADGYDPGPLPNDPRVRVIRKEISIGQRAATNLAARESQAKFIMKCDAHCAFDKGFDVKLMIDCENV
jgi:glycosyltransferase involved in cell wall biosynthesis